MHNSFDNIRKIAKGTLLNILEILGLSRYRLFWIKHFFISNKVDEIFVNTTMIDHEKLLIAGREIWLNIENNHERKYYENYKNGIFDVDYLIAKDLISCGDSVLDVGANIGITSLYYFKLGALEVHAFEPVPELYDKLSLLDVPQFKSYKFALSDKNGIENIFLSQSHNQGNTLNKEVLNLYPGAFGRKLKKTEINTKRLDSIFINKKFDFIKVDIEGHEIPFINGATNLFSYNPPRVLQIEIFDSLFNETDKLLSKYFNYVRRAIYSNKLQKYLLVSPKADISDYKEFQNQPPIYLYWNDPNVIRI